MKSASLEEPLDCVKDYESAFWFSESKDNCGTNATLTSFDYSKMRWGAENIIVYKLMIQEMEQKEWIHSG